MSKSKPYMLQLIEVHHDIANKKNLKLVPEKTFFLLVTVNYLDHEIGFITIKLTQSKISAIQILPPPTTKIIRPRGSLAQ